LTDVNSLTSDQRKQLRYLVGDQLDKYRFFKTTPVERIEATITRSYEARYHGATGTTSDPTAKTAIHNVDVPQIRREFIEKVERIVSRLPFNEAVIVKMLYMSKSEPFETQVRSSLKLSERLFNTRRDTAFLRIAEALGLKISALSDRR